MIILKEKVAGYNNTLTLATKEMKFGVNEGVKYVKPKIQGEQNATLEETVGTLKTQNGQNAHLDETPTTQGGGQFGPPLFSNTGG